MGAAFTQYTAEFEPGGRLGPTPAQRFVYVLEGELASAWARRRHKLSAGGYAYLPDGREAVVSTAASARRGHRKAISSASRNRAGPQPSPATKTPRRRTAQWRPVAYGPQAFAR